MDDLVKDDDPKVDPHKFEGIKVYKEESKQHDDKKYIPTKLPSNWMVLKDNRLDNSLEDIKSDVITRSLFYTPSFP